MSKLRFNITMSLDGFVAGPDQSEQDPLGVGGEDMERAGLASQFPLSDVAVMGPLSILPRLPRIMSRVYRTVDAAIAELERSRQRA